MASWDDGNEVAPKSKRIANEMNEGRKKCNTCRHYGIEGHNTRTCTST